MATIRPTFYELNESEVLTSYENLPRGAFICCKDSTNIYMTNVETGELSKMSETVKYLTESQRADLLAPISGKQYFCYDTGKMWVYLNGNWYCLNSDKPCELEFDVVIPAPVSGTTSSYTLNDSKIVTSMVGTFTPDLSVVDLISNVSVNITAGRAVISGTTSYEIPGILKLVY